MRESEVGRCLINFYLNVRLTKIAIANETIVDLIDVYVEFVFSLVHCELALTDPFTFFGNGYNCKRNLASRPFLPFEKHERNVAADFVI